MSKRTRALKDELYNLYPKLTPTAQLHWTR